MFKSVKKMLVYSTAMSTYNTNEVNIAELNTSNVSIASNSLVQTLGTVMANNFSTTITASNFSSPITAQTVNYYDSSGTIAALNSNLSALQAAVIPATLQTYASGTTTSSNVYDAAYNAWLAVAPYLMTINGLRQFAGAAAQAGLPALQMNSWGQAAPAIASPNRPQAVTITNVDTVYKVLFLDLTSGPVTMTVPDTSNLYYFSIEFFDARGDCAYLLTQRTIGKASRTFKIVGPNQLGLGPDIIRLPHSVTFGLARVSNVNDPDLSKGTSVLNSLIAGTFFPPSYPLLTYLTKYPGITSVASATLTGATLAVAANWANTFTNGQVALTNASILPYSSDVALMAKISRLSLGPKFTSAWSNAAWTSESSNIQNGISNAYTNAVSSVTYATANNWTYTPDYAFMTPVTQNYNLQNKLNYIAQFANPTTEASYYVSLGNGVGSAYSTWGSALLAFRPPSDFVAANGSFWSVTAYNYVNSALSILTTSQYYPPANVSNVYLGTSRCSIGTFTDTAGNGNTYYQPTVNGDGSVNIYLSRTEPTALGTGASLKNNWLPLPVVGLGAGSPDIPVSSVATTTNWLVVIRFYANPESVKNGNYDPVLIQENVGGNTLFNGSA